MYDAIAIGEVLIDFVIRGTNEAGYPILSAYPGGAGANYLAALSNFGLETSMISKVGTDKFGRMLKDTLRYSNIGVNSVISDEKYFTTMAFVTLDENGEREFSFARKPGADMCLNISEIEQSILKQSRSIYFGTTSLTSEPMRTAVKTSVEYAREHNKMVVFDPNIRKPLWEDLKDAKESMIWGLTQTDLLKISEEELVFLFGENMEEGVLRLHELYDISLIFVTLGEKGCYFSNKNASGYIEGLKNIQVIDTTGAGDIFAGSAVYKVLECKKALSDLEKEDLENITNFACVSAGLSAGRPGGMSSVNSISEIMAVMGNKIYY